MNNSIAPIISGIIIVISIIFYFQSVSSYRNTTRGNKIISYASQITFSSYIIGFAVILFVINTQGMSRRNFIDSSLLHAVIVCVINAGSLVYYKRKIPEE